MIKKILSFAIVMATMCSFCSIAMAADTSEANKISASETAQAYGITVDEVENFEANFSAAMSKIRGKEYSSHDTVIVPISENLIVEIDGGVSPIPTIKSRARVTQWHVWSTTHIKSHGGVEILTLTAHGMFDCDGSTAKPVDAYSDYVSLFWSVVDTNDEVMSTYTRSTFDSEFAIGIDPISMTIQTSRDVCVLRCTPDGVGSWRWN